jgi:hypothetical protein
VSADSSSAEVVITKARDKVTVSGTLTLVVSDSPEPMRFHTVSSYPVEVFQAFGADEWADRAGDVVRKAIARQAFARVGAQRFMELATLCADAFKGLRPVMIDKTKGTD